MARDDTCDFRRLGSVDAADKDASAGKSLKRRLRETFRRYSYGVPDQARARRSAANDLSLIVQDTIIPYRPSATAGAEPVHNQMRFFEFPWPREAPRALGAAEVTLRVILSTFIEPNPSEGRINHHCLSNRGLGGQNES